MNRRSYKMRKIILQSLFFIVLCIEKQLQNDNQQPF